jgi:mannose/cellobiose epimerase-like protein (N-acyl-D-glucosamine 2-epimerase family)
MRERGRWIGDRLRESVLPWWAATVDARHGGFQLAPDEKQLATQSRMVWTFSHAHRHALGDYLGAAEQGVEFLRDRFHDGRYGGYFWKTDRAGRVRNDRKILYGQISVIYALVEYAHAGGDPDALAEARALFDLLVDRAHDDVHGGWFEHFNRSWRPARRRSRGFEVEIPGLRSSNVQMHVMEMIGQLLAATGDERVASLLAETVELGTTQFFPADPAGSVQHRTRDWRAAGRADISDGHNVEFAWLLVRAETLLGREPSRARFENYLTAAMASRRPQRIWWEDAELLAALSVGMTRWPDPLVEDALDRHLEFLIADVIDPHDGIWWESVAWDGEPLSTEKMHTWKDAFHEVRAMVLLGEALAAAR